MPEPPRRQRSPVTVLTPLLRRHGANWYARSTVFFLWLSVARWTSMALSTVDMCPTAIARWLPDMLVSWSGHRTEVFGRAFHLGRLHEPVREVMVRAAPGPARRMSEIAAADLARAALPHRRTAAVAHMIAERVTFADVAKRRLHPTLPGQPVLDDKDIDSVIGPGDHGLDPPFHEPHGVVDRNDDGYCRSGGSSAARTRIVVEVRHV